MGLDMYLRRRKYIGRYDFMLAKEPMEFQQATDILTAAGLLDTQIPDAGVYVESTVMYWRKANAIHRWFVENVQGGVDECQASYVSRDDLVSLLEVVTEVLDRPEKASELLPTASGFFFGTTEFDEWYIQDLKNTSAILTKVLDTDADEFIYQASW